jgi:uncharacterized membrane protein
MCQLLFGVLAFLLASVSVAAGDEAAAYVGHVSGTLLSTLHDFTLGLGLICLILGVARFKKYRDSSGQSSLAVSVAYVILGIGLILIYCFG